jgi:hypothetical protein
MVALLTFMTGRSSTTSAGPTAYTWYDELIVSTQPGGCCFRGEVKALGGAVCTVRAAVSAPAVP